MNNKDRYKEPWFAVNLSSIFVGLGQLYAGKKIKGLLIIVLHFLLIVLKFWMIFYSNVSITKILLLLIIILGFFIWNLFDAYKSVSKNNDSSFERERKECKDPWLAVFLSHIPGVGHMYLKKWIWGILFVIITILIRRPFLIILFSLFVVYHVYNIYKVKRKQSNKLIIIFLAIYLIGQVIPFFVTSNIMQSFVIIGGSMSPTINSGERILINKFNKEIERGDIILYRPPPNMGQNIIYISRVVALEGETFEIKNGYIYINGEKTKNNYFSKISYKEGMYKTGKYTIPKDKFYVLEDDIYHWNDSRFFGFVPKTNVIGKVFRVYYPFKREKVF